MKTKIQEAIALVKKTTDLLNDVAGILSAVEKPKAKPDGTLDNKRIKVTPETKDDIESVVRSHGYTITDSYERFEENGYAWICIVVYEVSDNINDELFACYSFKDSPNYRKTTEAFISNGQLVDELPSEEQEKVCRWKNRHDEFNKVYSWSYCPYCGKKLEA